MQSIYQYNLAVMQITDTVCEQIDQHKLFFSKTIQISSRVASPMPNSEQRRSKRVKTEFHPLPSRLQSLFHSDLSESTTPLPAKLQLLHSNPNIFIVPNFLTDNEIEYFNQVCTENLSNFEESFVEDEKNQVIVNEHRTSTYIYLKKCHDATVSQIEFKAANLISLPSSCIEPLQIVSYTNGQRFNTHHDAGTLLENNVFVELVIPCRLVTLFVYLNDLPIDQGHTEFPLLKDANGDILSVQPKRGHALLFCNLLPNGQPDMRVIHRANPVESKLRKFGLNIWFSNLDMQPLSSSDLSNTVEKRKKNESAYCYEKSIFRMCDRIAYIYNSRLEQLLKQQRQSKEEVDSQTLNEATVNQKQDNGVDHCQNLSPKQPIHILEPGRVTEPG